MRFNIPKDELNKNRLVPPGWHNVEVILVETKRNKAGDADNDEVTVRIYSGPYAGTEKKVWFSEKFALGAAEFLKALGSKETAEGLEGEISSATCKGKKLKANFIRGEYKNKPQNEIIEWAPLD